MKRCLYTECHHNSKGTQCRCSISRKVCVKWPTDKKPMPAFRIKGEKVT